MPPGQAPTLAIVWHQDRWRCEYSKPARQLGSVVLYFGDSHLIERRISSIDEMRQVAHMWRDMVTSVSRGGLPIRRLVPDRRRLPRGGRRASDREQ